MLLEHVFWTADWLGLEHEHAFVSYRLRLLQDLRETPRFAFYTGGKCAGTIGGREHGNDAIGVRICGSNAGVELYVEIRGARPNLSKLVETHIMVLGVVLLWCRVCGTIEATGYNPGEAKISIWDGNSLDDRGTAWKRSYG